MSRTSAGDHGPETPCDSPVHAGIGFERGLPLLYAMAASRLSLVALAALATNRVA